MTTKVTKVTVSTIGNKIAIIVNSLHDGDVFVVNSATATEQGIVYDLRQASAQQIKMISTENALEMGKESENFLSQLIRFVSPQIKAQILAIAR